jgi:transcriptional regulator with XRE-family HTH domain
MNLYEARVKKRISQWDVAVATGLSQSKISLIERGYVIPSQSEKLLLCDALGVKEAALHWHERVTPRLTPQPR